MTIEEIVKEAMDQMAKLTRETTVLELVQRFNDHDVPSSVTAEEVSRALRGPWE